VIAPPRDGSAHLASAWTGYRLAFLAIGMQGAIQPLLPHIPNALNKLDVGEDVMIESFDPPPAPGEAATDTSSAEPVPPVEAIEIPIVPPAVTPLSPPEMDRIVAS